MSIVVVGGVVKVVEFWTGSSLSLLLPFFLSLSLACSRAVHSVIPGGIEFQ